MKQGLKDVKKRDKESYYKYLMQNHLDNPEQRRIRENTEKVKGTFGRMYKAFLNTIIFIILIAGIGAYIQGKFKNDQILNTKNSILPNMNSSLAADVKQQRIIKYINTIKPYQDNINLDVNLRNEDAKSVDKKLLTSKEYADNLTVYKNRINSNLVKMENVNCPEELNKYKDMLLEQNSTMCLAIDYEIQYINSRDKATFNKVVECFKKCNDINKEISDEINEVLDSNGMRH